MNLGQQADMSCRYAFDVLGELFYGNKFGFMSERKDIGNYMKAIDSLLPAFTIGGTVPSYLTKLYLVSTILSRHPFAGPWELSSTLKTPRKPP